MEVLGHAATGVCGSAFALALLHGYMYIRATVTNASCNRVTTCVKQVAHLAVRCRTVRHNLTAT
jgi:hypothetical protein